MIRDRNFPVQEMAVLRDGERVTLPPEKMGLANSLARIISETSDYINNVDLVLGRVGAHVIGSSMNVLFLDNLKINNN